MIKQMFFIFCLFCVVNCTSQIKTNEVLIKPTPIQHPIEIIESNESNHNLKDKKDFIWDKTDEPHLFSINSKDPNEFFRVLISSDSYMIHQIKGNDIISRRIDPGGDALMTEELNKYNLINFIDEGVVSVKLNPHSGKPEKINFHNRVPRINNIARIIHNDATRWVIEQKKGKASSITKFLIYYYVLLTNKSDREYVKNHLKKELKKSR